MPTLVVYRINADPLSTSDVTVLEEYIVDVTDDDTLLEWSDGSGAQLDAADLPPGFIGDSTNFQVFETYSGNIGATPVSFTLIQFSTPTLIIATQGTFDVGDTITGTGSTIVTAPSTTYDTLPDYVCFTGDTLIETPTGPRVIDRLKPGDLVLTAEGHAQPIKWIGQRHLDARALARNPHLRPVVIAPGTFGPGVPSRAVRVSPQHRLALATGASGIALGASAVLVAACHLTPRAGVSVDARARQVSYIHILLEDHGLVCAAGLWSETLFLGDTTLGDLSDAAHNEIAGLFPDLTRDGSALGRTCLPVASRHEARVALADLSAYRPRFDAVLPARVA
ncbi:Hint domain-containing protein [Gymnodinialimonas sp.]